VVSTGHNIQVITVSLSVRSVCRSGVLPNGERIPDVRVERLLPNGSCCWARQLVSVDDDLESRYLAAQRSKLEFSLTVPNHGAAVLTHRTQPSCS
jgi:hypothetical protein